MDDAEKIKSWFTPRRVLSDGRLRTVCLYGQGTKACKYIYCPLDPSLFPLSSIEFYCVKHIPELKEHNDERCKTALGDNCEGLL